MTQSQEPTEIFDGVTPELLAEFVRISTEIGFEAALEQFRGEATDIGPVYASEEAARRAAGETVQYLSIREFAERVDLAVNTVKGYRARGALPPADGRVGKTEGWLESTIDHWAANRSGQGARTDL